MVTTTRWKLAARKSPRRLPGPVPGEQVGLLPTPWGEVGVWRLDGHGGGIWVAVRDRGSGRLSCSAGRVLYDTARGIDLGTGSDGGLVDDLNFLTLMNHLRDAVERDITLRLGVV